MDERVIDTKTRIQNFPTPIPFRNFRYPHVNVFFDATFIANDNYVDTSECGIFRCAGKDGAVIPLALEGQSALPPGGRFRTFKGLQTHERNFCFSGVLDGFTNRVAVGLYASFWGEPLVCIANTEQTIPCLPSNRLFTMFGTIYDDTVLYTAYELHGDASYTDHLLLYDHRTGGSRLLLKTGDKLPNSQGGQSTVFGFSPTEWIYANMITVVNGHRRGWSSVHILDLHGPFEEPARNAVLIADTMMSPPGNTSGAFMNFYSAPLDRGRVAFVADYASNHNSTVSQGVYFWEEGILSKVADITDTIPGYDFRFTSFDIFVSLDKGKLIFRGFGADGFEGLFLYDPDVEVLFLLIDNTQVLDGKRIASFEIGSNSIVGGRMIFTARFHDNSMGIYMALTPAWKTPRLDMPIPAFGQDRDGVM